MLRFDGNGIEITRGDSVRFVIRCKGRELAEGTKAIFTVKSTPWELCLPAIEKEIDVIDGAVNVILEPYETDLTPGHYVWDIRMKENENVITPMAYASFRVLEAIGE